MGDGSNAMIRPAELFWDVDGGRLGLNTTAPEAVLHVASGNLLVTAGQVWGSSASSVSAPSFSWMDDANTGIYREGADVMAVGTGGVRRLRVGSDGMVSIDGDFTTLGSGGMRAESGPVLGRATIGDASTPSFAWIDDTDTGIYREGENMLAVGTGGVRRMHVGSNGIVTIDGDLVVSGGGGLRADQGQILGYAESNALAPSFGWVGDTDTGMFRPSEDAIAFTTGGEECVRITPLGRVGIGRSDPEVDLHIQGDVTIEGVLKGGYPDAGDGGTYVPVATVLTNASSNVPLRLPPHQRRDHQPHAVPRSVQLHRRNVRTGRWYDDFQRTRPHQRPYQHDSRRVPVCRLRERPDP